MNTFFLFIFLLALIVVLVISARIVETSFVHFANRFSINSFFLGFVVLAIVTSLPEISIAIIASNELPQLSLGNLIGATIVILTLIIGIAVVRYKGIEFKGKFSEKELLLGLISICSMVIVVLDSAVTIVEGIGLMLIYAAFVYYLYKKFNKKSVVFFHLTIDSAKPAKIFMEAIVGLVGLVIASSYIVSTAEQIAVNLNISASLIGILLLAIGTNLPEITILLTANDLESEELAIGNFFGSACVNVAILGLLAITSKGFVITDMTAIVGGLVILFFSILLFIVFSWTGKKLSRNEGLLLLAVYFAFLISELFIYISISR